MKISDISIRTIKIHIDNNEIINLICNYIKQQENITFTQFDEFKFEIVKEGSPEYITNKVKCTCTKRVDLNK